MPALIHLRLVTYGVLVVAAAVALYMPRRMIPVALQGPPYEQQAAAMLLAAHVPKDWARNFGVSGGVPAGEQWTYREGPDCDVWVARYRLHDANVRVGVYRGGFPQIKPPPEGLSPGLVGGLPVLWWQREAGDYETLWDAIIPEENSAGGGGFVHVWIASMHPSRVKEAAELLQALKFAP